jgi:hypothetical protein
MKGFKKRSRPVSEVRSIITAVILSGIWRILRQMESKDLRLLIADYDRNIGLTAVPESPYPEATDLEWHFP